MSWRDGEKFAKVDGLGVLQRIVMPVFPGRASPLKLSGDESIYPPDGIYRHKVSEGIIYAISTPNCLKSSPGDKNSHVQL